MKQDMPLRTSPVRAYNQHPQVEGLLDTLIAQLSELRESEKKRHRSEAPNFSAFTYIDPDENLLSAILADLLAPWGTHGQGDAFLQAFLELLELPELRAETCYRIRCEAQTDVLRTARRIDILLEGKDWIVGVENKPWAADQPRQVRDYLDDLAGRGKARSVLVYLTKDGRPPSDSSIDVETMTQTCEDGRLVLFSFQQIAHWLGDCEEVCAASRVKEFLRDFQSYIDGRLLGQAPEREVQMIVDIVTSSEERLDAALELVRSANAIRMHLVRKAMGDISKLIKNEWTITRQLDEANAGIGLKPPGADRWHICLEPQRGSYGQWIYGIKHDALGGDDSEARLAGERLMAAMPTGAKSSGLWPYYREFSGFDSDGLDPRHYRDWEASADAWKDMHTGKFAQNIVRLAEKLHAAAVQTPARLP